MVTGDQIMGRFHYESRNPNVVPSFRVFRDENVVLMKMKLLNFVSRGRSFHEGYSLSDAVILIDIDIVAESDWQFVIPCVLVNVADSHFSNSP